MLAVSRDSEITAYLLDELSRRGWSPADLAREADVRKSTVSRNLTGERHPTPETLRRYAEALGLSEDHLLSLAGHRTPRRRDLPPELEAVLEGMEETWEYMTPEQQELTRWLISQAKRKRKQ